MHNAFYESRTHRLIPQRFFIITLRRIAKVVLHGEEKTKVVLLAPKEAFV